MAGDDHHEDDGFEDGHEGDHEELPLDEHETTLVQRDLDDLTEFEATFRPEGYRGVAVFCHDCVEEHYYEWDMLRENLQMLIDSGETPVHEPAFSPDPALYVPWDYARGYIDALNDAGVGERLDLGACPRCRFVFPEELRQTNFCPRCGAPMLRDRIIAALDDLGMPEEDIDRLMSMIGLPAPHAADELP